MGFLVSRKDFLIERTYTPRGALVNTQQGGCEAREFAFVTALRQSGGFWSSLYALISKTEDKSYRSYCSDCLAYFFPLLGQTHQCIKATPSGYYDLLALFSPYICRNGSSTCCVKTGRQTWTDHGVNLGSAT